MEIRRLGRPELEVRDLHRRAAVLEHGPDLVLAVEEQFPLEVALPEVHRLDLHGACLVVAGPHEELAVVQRERHAVEEPAVEVEVVIRKRELLRVPVQHVVDGGEYRVLARSKRAGRDLQPGPWIWLDSADLLPVYRELRAQPHSVHDDPGALNGLLQPERPAVEASAALAEPFRLHVVASRHGHAVGRGEIRAARRLKRLALLEAELPRPVQVDGAKARRGTQCRRGRNHAVMFHHLVSFFFSELTDPQ